MSKKRELYTVGYYPFKVQCVYAKSKREAIDKVRSEFSLTTSKKVLCYKNSTLKVYVCKIGKYYEHFLLPEEVVNKYAIKKIRLFHLEEMTKHELKYFFEGNFFSELRNKEMFSSIPTFEMNFLSDVQDSFSPTFTRNNYFLDN